MSPEEAQQNAPRRRGRPPGSKNKTSRPRGGGDVVGQLNSMVAELIKRNRQLQRQVAALSAKAEKTSADKSAERGIRTLSRRVQRALGTKQAGRRKKAGPADGRRKKPATRRRRAGQ